MVVLNSPSPPSGGIEQNFSVATLKKKYVLFSCLNLFIEAYKIIGTFKGKEKKNFTGNRNLNMSNKRKSDCIYIIFMVHGSVQSFSMFWGQRSHSRVSSSHHLQVRLQLHGAGPRPCRPLQPGAHHLPAQTGRTLLSGLLQHVNHEGLPAPVRPSLDTDDTRCEKL